MVVKNLEIFFGGSDNLLGLEGWVRFRCVEMVGKDEVMSRSKM